MAIESLVELAVVRAQDIDRLTQRRRAAQNVSKPDGKIGGCCRHRQLGHELKRMCGDGGRVLGFEVVQALHLRAPSCDAPGWPLARDTHAAFPSNLAIQKKLMKETSQSDFKPPSVALGSMAFFGNTLPWNAHRRRDKLVQKTFCNGAKRKFSSCVDPLPVNPPPQANLGQTWRPAAGLSGIWSTRMIGFRNPASLERHRVVAW